MKVLEKESYSTFSPQIDRRLGGDRKTTRKLVIQKYLTNK